ncbi:hypothetical protein GCM10027568_17150 [Humibacter soli]
MTGGTLSGGVVIALAAALWLAYLVPTWLRRRDYLNAERNAVRLQQTLRILAETAEAPEEVHVEATAREVARQQKVLKKARAKADAAARAVSSTPPASEKRPVLTREERDRAFARAVRRTRLATSGVMLAALVGIGAGVYSLVMAASWWLLAASVVLMLCAFGVQRRLAAQVVAHRSARQERPRAVQADPELFDHVQHIEPERVEPKRDVSWKPQPLPKPLYQSPGSRAAAAMASVDAAVALRRAAVRAELEERAARIAASQVPTLPAATAAPAATLPAAAPSAGERTSQPSRYTRMGVVADVQGEHIDLDEALRRRRAAG